MTVASQPAARRALPNGVWGMTLFLCAEVALFGTLLGSYFYLDFNTHHWPPAGVPAPEVILPLVATAGLLTSLVPIGLAGRRARIGQIGRTIAWIAVAMLIQGAYLAAQILLFRHDFSEFRPQATAYGSIYFTLLTVHHAHVAFGLALDLAVIGNLVRRGLSDYWRTGVRGLVLYWYVVGGLAVVVVLTQLSPSL